MTQPLKRPQIALLPPAVAERIAAGEVVERPASIVKEAVENALDAGATEIEVRLEDGGRSLIEILDNGCGMSESDLPLALQRHATSKLRSLADLDRIVTLGFRGEALPSIAAVAELRILSRPVDGPVDREESTAYELEARIEGPSPVHRLTHGTFAGGSPHGTRIQARGLFAQVPARLKFLKSAAAEVSAVREWMERLALTHPTVGFKLSSETRVLLNLRPSDTLERIRAILADGEDFPIVSSPRVESPGLSLQVHWLQGLSSPQTRKIVQIVNGRAVRDRVIQQALLQPFRQSLLPGQFPAVALYLELDPASIDVNVHPAKTEIRLLDSGRIFREIDRALGALIQKHGSIGFAAGQRETQAPSWSAEAPRPFFSSGSLFAGTSSPALPPFPPGGAHPAPLSSLPESHSEALSEELKPSPIRALLSAGTFAGTLFQTYVLYDLGQELVLIDQHAAHERIRYEKLRARALSQAASSVLSSRQPLLIPEAVHFAPEQRPLLEARLPWLEKLGFEVEVFGESAALFRTIPSEWGAENLRIRLKGLVERLLSLPGTEALTPGGLLLDETRFEKLASEACHSAIRAGDRLERMEIEALVDALGTCEHPWNCPHGRPTLARIPRSRFEEWFLRRV